jgi:hypothetical protein
LQGNHYIRPTYIPGRGWSLAVVDLQTGNRADLSLSPDSTLSRVAPNIPAFALDPSGTRIVSKGLGTDAAKLERYNRATADGWWDLPFPSLLAFDVQSLHFYPSGAARASGTATQSPRPLDLDLLGAASRGDAARVGRALDAGADPNAADEGGVTALMLAAESIRPFQADEPTRLLLARGASVFRKDASGLTAMDHFTVMSQRLSTQAERRAFDLLNGAMRDEYLSGRRPR